MVAKPAAGKLIAQYLRKNVTSSKTGVVVSAGKMHKAVKVRVAGQEWNKHIRKYFPRPTTHLVADPNSSLHEGDVVRISSGYRFSKQIRHVVTAIVAPFGPPASERPPVLSEEQLLERRLQERLLKDVRSKEKGRLISVWRLKEAKKAGYEIPDLETAMANIKLAEAAKEAEGVGKGKGEKQQLTATEKIRAEKAKKREAREKAEKEALKAEKEAKKAEEKLAAV